MLISKAVLSGRIQQKSWNLNSQTPLLVSYVIKVLLSYQICVFQKFLHTQYLLDIRKALQFSPNNDKLKF